MRDIGKNIKTLRTAKGMTQEDLAALFVTRQTVSNYENGRSRPDLDMLLNIAQVLDTDATAILYGPPQSPYRKPALIRLAVGGAALAVVWGARLYVAGLNPAKLLIGWAILAEWVLRPLSLFLLGWELMQLGSLTGKLTPLWGKKWVIFRRGVMVVTAVVALMLLPDALWICAEAVNNLLGASLQLSYIITALGWAGLVKIWLHTSFSAFYLILGALCWLAGLGNKKPRDENK